MKRKTLWLSLIAISLFVFLAAHAQNPSPAATISKIGVQPGPLNTRVILEADSPVLPAKTYYSGRAVVLEFNRVNASTAPQIQIGDLQLVQAINLEKAAGDQARLRVELTEPVPYRVLSSDGRTIVELNRIQRGGGAVEAEAQKQSAAAAQAPRPDEQAQGRGDRGRDSVPGPGQRRGGHPGVHPRKAAPAGRRCFQRHLRRGLIDAAGRQVRAEKSPGRPVQVGRIPIHHEAGVRPERAPGL